MECREDVRFNEGFEGSAGGECECKAFWSGCAGNLRGEILEDVECLWGGGGLRVQGEAFLGEVAFVVVVAIRVVVHERAPGGLGFRCLEFGEDTG